MIAEYQCSYEQEGGAPPEIPVGSGITFPEAYQDGRMMAELSLAGKEKQGAPFCMVPFCHTVEAEAMGGLVSLGDREHGPRAREYCCHSLKELLHLPEIDYGKGRIREVLRACQILREEGHETVLMISGPLTICNVLIDPKYIYKGIRKEPELVKEILNKLQDELLRFIEEAMKQGVRLISYADSAGAVSILGPKMAAWMAEEFTAGFVKKAVEKMDQKALLLLCPKTTLALIGTGLAEYKDHILPEPMRYGEACISMIGTARVAGQMCVKNAGCRLENGRFREIKLCGQRAERGENI